DEAVEDTPTANGSSELVLRNGKLELRSSELSGKPELRNRQQQQQPGGGSLSSKRKPFAPIADLVPTRKRIRRANLEDFLGDEIGRAQQELGSAVPSTLGVLRSSPSSEADAEAEAEGVSIRAQRRAPTRAPPRSQGTQQRAAPQPRGAAADRDEAWDIPTTSLGSSKAADTSEAWAIPATSLGAPTAPQPIPPTSQGHPPTSRDNFGSAGNFGSASSSSCIGGRAEKRVNSSDEE
ncbi:unnamed protein product, partial [Polarella glacialis]